jgi:hypothetical protein
MNGLDNIARTFCSLVNHSGGPKVIQICHTVQERVIVTSRKRLN